MQVDGYTGYNRVKDRRDNAPIELAYCWAHARRKLFELTINNVAPIAEEGIKQIKAFYRIEAHIRGMAGDERLAIRREKTLPRMKAFLTMADPQPCASLGQITNGAGAQIHCKILGRFKPIPHRWSYRDRQQYSGTFHAPHCIEP